MKKAAKILLVDDDADDQLFFKDAMDELSDARQFSIANNGLEALEQMKIPPPPDLIFLDLNMPVMNGYECLARLKSLEKYKDIPVIIFSTSANEMDIRRSREMGAHLFFTKPANFNVLCSKLEKILDMDFSQLQFTV